MLPRFFYAELALADKEITLPEALAHHAERVLRLRPGQRVVLFDGEGREAQAELLRLGRDPCARIKSVCEVDRETPLRLTLVQALATGDKMDWIVQKAVELGISSLQPVAAERSVLRLEGIRAVKRIEHWQQIAVAAAEQSGRNRLMTIAPVMSLSQCLSVSCGTPRWALLPSDGTRLSAMPAPREPVALLIGPEGGWSEREVMAMLAAGCQGVTLGPRVLRTETAGLAAAAAMQALWGDF
ncbi:MAG: 16S rRNA (uracil(1498)-N(3))-methyltransferase [Betaproteobacteria bacterium]|nr:16S rRNA (uracil(1498)-N(3))-methyltransferase [Betaproteobacteria bacterium]